MLIFVISDIHSPKWDGGCGKADILLSLGDTYDEVIIEAAKSYECDKILAVRGNHDRSCVFMEPIIDIHMKTIVYKGVIFGGFNGSWKYKPVGNYLYTQDEAKKLIKKLPYVDIFLSHNAPRGVHDRDDHVHVGFESLKLYIDTMKPRYVLHGHQHTNQESRIGSTTVISVHGSILINYEQ